MKITALGPIYLWWFRHTSPSDSSVVEWGRRGLVFREEGEERLRVFFLKALVPAAFCPYCCRNP